MRVTAKGQVTIPLAIRDRLGFVPGSEVEFEVRGGKAVLTKARSSRRGSAIVARMRGSATAGLTTDEILALTRR